MFDELFLMSFRSSNGSGMGATGATSGMSKSLSSLLHGHQDGLLQVSQ